jgi:uncharacterized protein (TIGR02145 family)
MLKETGYLHWNGPNTGATNEYGFSVLGSGLRTINGTGNLLMMGVWWSGTEYDINPDKAWGVVMSSDLKSASIYMDIKYYGFAVRCIKG